MMEDVIPGENKKTLVTADIFTRLHEDATEYTGENYNTENIGVVIDVNKFMDGRKDNPIEDPEWYRLYPNQRIARQVWYNTNHATKRYETEFILNSIDNKRSFNILDFGCGIGIPAFYLAEKGHKVSAMDIRGTGTLEFLKWRSGKYGIPIKIMESEGGAPVLNGDKYDVIIAMDCLEHIKDWKIALAELGKRLSPGGVFFSNNGVLGDTTHPEHYKLDNKEFIAECMSNDLMPFNQITFVKKESKNAEITNTQP
jgi:SAM-dependent methyltransferase